MSRDCADLRGKTRQIFVHSCFVVVGKKKSLILLASSVNCSRVLHEFCFIKKSYILHIFLLVLVDFLEEEWAVDSL